jgi:hypothetical protein
MYTFFYTHGHTNTCVSDPMTGSYLSLDTLSSAICASGRYPRALKARYRRTTAPILPAVLAAMSRTNAMASAAAMQVSRARARLPSSLYCIACRGGAYGTHAWETLTPFALNVKRRAETSAVPVLAAASAAGLLVLRWRKL